MSESQTASTVLMVRPVAFGFNPETADSNRFQSRSGAHATDATDVATAACREFDALARALADAGVTVHVAADTPEPRKSDAVFPNNWVSFHADGTIVLYPMMAPSRRSERRMDVITALIEREGLAVSRIVDLVHRESEEKFLEGTGSLVLDRPGRIAYACLSPRTHLDVIGEFAQLLDYEPVVFDAFDAGGRPIYHTNVLLTVGSRFAAACLDAIPAAQRGQVRTAIEAGGREIVQLGLSQLEDFTGNMLELRSHAGQTFVAMSARAQAALEPAQRRALERLTGGIVAVPIPVIEEAGGGSVRCMIAEVHLPTRRRVEESAQR
jgi:hypothetical protein